MPAKKKSTSTKKDHIIYGTSEMAERIRLFDWATTLLGPLDSWSQSLITAVNLILQSPVPIVMLWGKEGNMIYNDAYSIFAGQRHPSLLGCEVVKGWPEVADFNRNVMKHGLQGKALSYRNQKLTLFRNNLAENVWMNLNFSPIIDEYNKPAGVMAIVVETTQQVLAEQKQKKAEKALQDERDKFLTLIEKSTTAVQMATPEGKILYTSASIVNVLGYTPDELNGQGILPFLHPEDREGFFKNFNELIKHPEHIIIFQYRVKHKDGSWAWLETTGVNHLQTANINALIGTFRNITKEKRQQEALIESEERFRVMSDTVPVMIWITEPSGKCTYLNKQWYDYTGQSVKESLGFGWLKAVHPDDEKASGEAFLQANKKQMAFSTEYRLRAKDGTYRWHLDSALPKFDKYGKYEGLIGSVVDIHERKIAEEALKASKERQVIMLQASKLGLWYCDLPFDDLMWDEKVKEHFWMPKDIRVTIDKFYEYMHPDDREKTKNAIEYSIANHTSYDIEYRTVNKKDGRIKWIQALGRTFYDAKDNPIRFDGVTIDITERKALERQKDDFLGIASHELKTPVTSIKAYGQTLEMYFRRKGDVKAADRLHKLDLQVDKLTKLISDLLDVTKIQSGKMLFHESEFDFNELIKEIVEEVQRTAPKHKIKMQLQKGRTITGDRDRIGQVLANLLINAVKYSPQTDTVIISSEANKNSVQIFVKDFGVGIPQSMQERIFEQFFRVSGNKQETFPGLGLGLYISRQIIQREGGKIWVDSTEGKGSTFFVELPLNKEKKI